MREDEKEMHWNRGEELAGRDGGNARNYRRCRDKRVKRKQKGDWKKRGDVSKKISKPVFSLCRPIEKVVKTRRQRDE